MKNVLLRSIAFNYPGFQSLPRGIKQMLVVTESFVFCEERVRSRAEYDRPPVPLRPLAETDRALASFHFALQ